MNATDTLTRASIWCVAAERGTAGDSVLRFLAGKERLVQPRADTRDWHATWMVDGQPVELIVSARPEEESQTLLLHEAGDDPGITETTGEKGQHLWVKKTAGSDPLDSAARVLAAVRESWGSGPLHAISWRAAM